MAKQGKITIDLSNAESGGSRRHPEGDYRVELKKIERARSQSDTAQLKVTYEIQAGPKNSGSVVDYMALTEKAQWRIGNLLDALGIKWKKAKMELPLEKMVGKELGVTLTDDEYQGKVKSKISDFLDLETINGILEGSDDEDDDDEDEVEEKPKNKGKGKGKKKGKKDEEDDVDELDVDEDL